MYNVTVAGAGNPRQNRKEVGRMNRAQRRAKHKATPRYLRETTDERIRRLCKNGITPQDLKKEWDEGYSAGFRDAAPCVIKTAYAAICLALQDLHGYGRKRCADVLREVDNYIVNSLTSAEAIEEVFDRIGLYINFDEPFERIEEK